MRNPRHKFVLGPNAKLPDARQVGIHGPMLAQDFLDRHAGNAFKLLGEHAKVIHTLVYFQKFGVRVKSSAVYPWSILVLDLEGVARLGV
ncbi:MAG TPA: hypothetical protein VJ750_02785 [Rhizomicrobium sp.]|nr:hypothetical protein [Rhizomicrobium sp.]